MNNPLLNSETAFYVFDIDRLSERVSYLKKKLCERIELCYAVKANTFIIGELIGKIDKFEVCSPGEAEICSSLGVSDKSMVISGVYKTPSVIEKMVKEHDGRIYTVESITQFEMLVTLSEKYNRVLPVLLRLTNDSQFGINADEIKSIIANRSNYKYLDIHGLQFFSGTQKTSLKKLKREISKLDELLTLLQEEYGFESKELEFGSGFPVAYFEGEDIGEEELLKGFCDIIDSMQNKVKVVLELGRSMAACCGKYYTHIVDIKHNKGQNYILIDGGMHHLVYFGQHMAMKQPIFSVCGKENKENTAEWNICGSLCSMNDIVAKQVSLPDVSIGDLLCFQNTGAYCMTECISLFLSREIPAVYLKKADEYKLVRKSIETSAFNMPNIERK